ncbi:MAG: MFS transporter [Candidatus Promineifilaceae bacterium]
MKKITTLLDRTSQDPLIFPLHLPSFLTSFSQGLLIPVLPLYANSFGISYGLIGIILAGEALGMVLGDLPAGLLSQRWGPRRIHVLGLGGAALGTLGLIWAATVPQVILLRIFGGMGIALFQVSRHTFIADAIPNSRRGKPTALLVGLMRTGLLIGPAVGGLVASRVSLRLPFFICSLAILLALLCVARYLPADLAKVRNPPLTLAALRKHYREVLSENGRPLATAGVARVFALMVRSGRRIVIPLYAADVLGLDVGTIGLLVSLSMAVEVPLFYPAGWILDRLGRKYAIVPSYLIFGIGMALVPLTNSFLGLLIVSLFMGIGSGLSAGSLISLGADLAPANAPGTFLSIWWFIGDMGSAGGPLLVGAVADLFVLQSASLLMGGAGLLTAGLFFLLVPETLKKLQSATD